MSVACTCPPSSLPLSSYQAALQHHETPHCSLLTETAVDGSVASNCILGTLFTQFPPIHTPVTDALLTQRLLRTHDLWVRYERVLSSLKINCSSSFCINFPYICFVFFPSSLLSLLSITFTLVLQGLLGLGLLNYGRKGWKEVPGSHRAGRAEY